jgi:polysaccharide pyruvyl transferase WcaK-like protein
MNIVAPFGFYGSGNIGDDATLLGFARLLVQSGVRAKVSVGSRNPAHNARVEPAFQYFRPSGRDPRRWWAKLRASAHAIIGGTPIMDVLGEWPLCELTPLVRSIDRWKVPLAFIGVGIENLRLCESRRIVSAEITPRVRHWSVRCDRDKQRLIDYGVSPDVITVAADSAWLIEPVKAEFGRDHLRRLNVDLQYPLIGVNLVNENSMLDQYPTMVDALAAALDELASKLDARIIFLASEVRGDATFDKAAAIQVIGRMTRANRAILAPNDYFSPREMMSIISCCDLTMSMRYHFCLFSALQGVPFIAIPRSDKVSDLCWDIDWPARVVPPRFDALEIVEHGTGLAQNTSAVKKELKQTVKKMGDRALRNIAALTALSAR